VYHIIINPNAGRGRTLGHLPHLTRLFAENRLMYTTHITTGIFDAREKAREICENHPNSAGIIGIGGDGTFQEIAAGVRQAHNERREQESAAAHSLEAVNSVGGDSGVRPASRIPLGIFPAGSGNDFITTLEYEKSGGKKSARSKYGKNAEHNARAFFDTLMRGETRTIDVITANGTAFLNIGNIGLDARIVQTAGALKKRFGSRAYYAAVYQSVVHHKNLLLVIEADGKKFCGEYTLVAVCNGQYYGGGMRVAPTARLDDGKITLCLAEGISRPKIMALFPLLAMAKHERLKFVKFIECENVKISLPNSAESLCLDGNLYPNIGDEIEFKILPRALEVFV